MKYEPNHINDETNKCLCKECRENRSSKPAEKLTGEDFIEAARLRFLAKRKRLIDRER